MEIHRHSLSYNHTHSKSSHLPKQDMRDLTENQILQIVRRHSLRMHFGGQQLHWAF